VTNDASATSPDEFPIPVRFDLPGDAWRPVAPASIGITHALFAAMRGGLDGDYTPVLTFSGGWRTDDKTMEQIADEAVMLLREETGEAQLLDRRAYKTDTPAPSYSQVIRTSIRTDTATYNLVRLQAVMGFAEPEAPRRRAVLIVSTTFAAEHLDVITPEFQELVRGLRVDPAATAS